jgi:hypothetical protein
MAGNNNETEKRLWDVANELRANSGLKASEYSVPVLGLIFLRYAEFKFAQAEQELKQEMENNTSSLRRKNEISKVDYQAKGVLYLPEKARYTNLLNLPEKENIGEAINEAMGAIEAENPELTDILPKTYTYIENELLIALYIVFTLPDRTGSASMRRQSRHEEELHHDRVYPGQRIVGRVGGAVCADDADAWFGRRDGLLRGAPARAAGSRARPEPTKPAGASPREEGRRER